MERLKKVYFNKKNNFAHGVMFHHFHDEEKYPKSPGSLNKKEFSKIINHIGRKNIVEPKIFIKKMIKLLGTIQM